MEKRMIPVSEPDIGLEERKALLDAFDSSWISSKGYYIEKFEREFADFVGVRHAITTSNGTVSLHLILLALGIGPGDEVIVPTFTYIASVNSIRYVGATPVFVDSEPDTWNIDPEDVKRKITDRTKAIMTVHIYGHSVDIDPLLEICVKKRLYLIEDSAEATGTLYKGKHVGSFGIAGSFSFFGNKTITTGEGGMVVTNNEDLAKKIRKLKNQGNSDCKRYWHDVIGYNYRMTNLQAAIGYAQLKRVNELVGKKRQIAKWYKKYLKHELIQHPLEKEYCKNSYWMYSILLNSTLGDKRELIMELLLKEFGIETRPFFYPAHLLPMYKNITKASFPVVESFYFRGINLPSSTKLTEGDIRFVSEAFLEIIASIGGE